MNKWRKHKYIAFGNHRKLNHVAYIENILYWYTNLQFSDWAREVSHNGENNDFVSVLQCKNAKIAQTKVVLVWFCKSAYCPVKYKISEQMRSFKKKIVPGKTEKLENI